MKLAIIYNKDDHKLSPDSYSQPYRHMFDALVDRFDEVQHVTESCSAADIEADVIIVFDIHSSHHIVMDGLSSHRALKFTYINDPHQEDMDGRYNDGTPVYKLGVEKRIKRIRDRGINYIICPYTDGYNKYLAPHLGDDAEDMFVWFPVAPKKQNYNWLPLKERHEGILANGHLWEGTNGFRPYMFRNWAYRRETADYVKHHLSDDRVPYGNSYVYFLSRWAGSFALTDCYVVPKYLEIPLAGCLCFAQKQTDYEQMGFIDKEHYMLVDKENFDDVTRDFLNNVESYQLVADAGRKLIEQYWTAERFGDYIHTFARRELHNGS